MSPTLSSDSDRAWLSTLTLLYVEDDALTRSELSAFLSRRVGQVVQAADGAEGLAKFREVRPAIVVTDIRTAGMDGLTMAEEIRRIDPDIPIVVTTAFEQIDYLGRAIDAGVDKYVTKPIDLDKLDEVLLARAGRLRSEAAVLRERKRELHAARKRTREVVGLLAGGMAHDFSNLLQVVVTNLFIAGEMAAPESGQRAILDAATKATEEAGLLAGKLRGLAEFAFGHFASGALVPPLRAAVTDALTGSRTALEWHLPDDLPPVWQDEQALGQALGQLASNAREAMTDAGTLCIDAAIHEVALEGDSSLSPGRYVQVTFRDTGPGIAADVLPKVFDPYFSTKPRGTLRGMGLGLALVQAIVRRHGGRVTAASPPGGGAIFTVLVPTFAPERVPTTAAR